MWQSKRSLKVLVLLYRQFIDELTKIENELNDLETSDPLFPGNADTAGTLEVVPVHDHVHSQIQNNRNP